jgi:hypothetical protein
MGHLSREDLLARIDGASLGASAGRHLQQCTRCQAEAAALEAALRELREIDAPEPSPLFWNHLAARIRTAVAQEPLPRGLSLAVPGWRWWVPASGLAAAVVALVLSAGAPHSLSVDARPVVSPPQVAPAVATDDEAAGAWDLVVEVAASAEWGENNDVWLEPASAERAATEWSAEDQARLMRVLSDELTKSPL